MINDGILSDSKSYQKTEHLAAQAHALRGRLPKGVIFQSSLINLIN